MYVQFISLSKYMYMYTYVDRVILTSSRKINKDNFNPTQFCCTMFNSDPQLLPHINPVCQTNIDNYYSLFT